MSRLAEAFLGHLEPRWHEAFGDEDELEHELRRGYEQGRATWKTVELDPVVFASDVAVRLSADAATQGRFPAFERVYFADLYLACALARGDGTALAVFQRELHSGLLATFRARGLSEDASEDLGQTLIEHLVVGTQGRPGCMCDYSGRGPLRAWLTVSAIRMANRTVARLRKDAPESLRSFVGLVAADPDHDIFKAEYGPVLQRAFDLAMDGLDPRERTVLRMQVIDGLSIDEIGRIFAVHRATAARWLGRARESIRMATRDHLVHSLGLEAEVADSVIRSLSSQLELSITRVLSRRR